MGPCDRYFEGEERMKYIQFNKVYMENFFAYQEPMEFEFVNNSITLITGPNGRGKSTIFASIPYCLFGVTQKGQRNDDVVNRKTGKACKVVNYFDIIEDDVKTSYRVERYVKYPKKIGSTAFVFVNDSEEPVAKGYTEVTAYCENLICPKDLFFNTILFAQNVKDFFTDLTDSKQKEIFRKILQLDAYAEYQQNASKKAKECQSEVDKIRNFIIRLEEAINQYYSDIEEQKVSIAEYEKENIAIDGQIVVFVKEIKKVQDEMGDFGNREELDRQLVELNEERLSLNTLESEIRAERNVEINKINSSRLKKLGEFERKASTMKQSSLEKMSAHCDVINSQTLELQKKRQAEIDIFNKQISQLKADSASNIAKYEMNAKSIQHYEGLIHNHTPICPTCQRNWDDPAELKTIVENLKRENESLSEEIRRISSEVEKLENRRRENSDVFTRQIVNLDEKIPDIKQASTNEISEIQQRLNIASQALEEKSTEMATEINKTHDLKMGQIESQKLVLGEKLKALQDKLSTLQIFEKQILTIQEQSSKWQIKQESNKSAIEVLKKQIKTLEERIEETHNKCKESKHRVVEYNKKMEIYKFWAGGFSAGGIQSMLIDEAIPFMNQQSSNYLDLMSNGRYSVSFDTMSTTKSGEFRDKISVNVYDSETHSNSRNGFSGGQTRLVDIATILTLGDLQTKIQGFKTNILLFDEIFDALDEANTANVAKALRTILNSNLCEVIITHRHIDQVEAEQVYSF